MPLPASLAQRVYLLAHDPAKGRVRIGTHLGAMLRAGALADLYLAGHLSDLRGRATVAGRRPPGDPLLAALLEEIAGSRPRKWQHWIGRRHRATIGTVRRQLGDGGWARLQPYKILGLFPATRVTPRDPRVRTELLSRLKRALRAPVDRVDPGDAALVTIVATAKLDLVLDRATRRDSKRRIQQLTGFTGPIGPALHRSIQAGASGAEGA